MFLQGSNARLSLSSLSPRGFKLTKTNRAFPIAIPTIAYMQRLKCGSRSILWRESCTEMKWKDREMEIPFLSVTSKMLQIQIFIIPPETDIIRYFSIVKVQVSLPFLRRKRLFSVLLCCIHQSHLQKWFSPSIFAQDVWVWGALMMGKWLQCNVIPSTESRM